MGRAPAVRPCAPTPCELLNVGFGLAVVPSVLDRATQDAAGRARRPPRRRRRQHHPLPAGRRDCCLGLDSGAQRLVQGRRRLELTRRLLDRQVSQQRGQPLELAQLLAALRDSPRRGTRTSRVLMRRPATPGRMRQGTAGPRRRSRRHPSFGQRQSQGAQCVVGPGLHGAGGYAERPARRRRRTRPR